MLNQKRSELLRLLFIVSMLVLTVGVVLVLSTNDRTVASNPTTPIVRGNITQSINFTITNNEGDTINDVRITKPGTVGAILCLDSPPSGWICTNTTATYVEFTLGSIVAGGSTTFNVSINTPLTTGNESFDVRTSDGTALNTTKHNVSVDSDAPLIYNNSMNLSDGNVTMLNASTLARGTGWVKLQDLTFNITITDVFYNLINASIYYRNTTNINENVTFPPFPSAADSYNNTITLTSANPATGRYNGTIPASLLTNGTRIFFTIVANDSVGNVNITNLTTSTYNFSVDGVAPLLSVAPNIITEFDAGEDNIITSSVAVNFTLNVTDNGGSGVSRVDINTSATTGWVNMTQNGTGSAIWLYSGSLSSLGVAAGDRNLTVYFRAFDNVSNANNSIATLNVLVDDDAPQFAIGLFSPANITDEVLRQNFTTSNTSVLNFSILIYANLNYTGGHSTGTTNNTVATIMGPDGRVYNLSFISKTSAWDSVGGATQMVYSSLWYSAQSPQSGGVGEGSLNSTNSSLKTLGCGQLNPDGGVCPILINVTDIFGRSNSTNISITFDNVSAHTTNFTTNATRGDVQVVRSGSIINFTLSASNNVQNVTIHANASGDQISNGTLMTSIGSNNYSVVIGARSVCGPSEGICRVNFSVVDKALNINRSGIAGASFPGSTVFIVDSSAPLVSNFFVNGTANGTAGPEAVVGTGAVRVYKSDVTLNISFNVTDQVSSVTQVRIGNSTLRNTTTPSTIVNSSTLSYDSYYNVSTLASFGCTANVESDCVLRVYALDNFSIDNLVNENNTVNLTFRVDDLKPRVVNFSTNLTYNHRVTSSTTIVNFTVNVTDANIVNVSVANTTVILMNRSSAATTSNSTPGVWTVATTLTALGCTADGNCSVTVYANDSAGNVNASQWLSVNLDSSTISTVGMNLSLGEYTTGSTTNDSTPMLWLNLTTNSLCRYSTPNAVPYASMTAMGGDGTSAHSVTLSALSDGAYNYYFRCVDNLNVEPSNFLQSLTFAVAAAPSVLINNLTTDVVFNISAPTLHVNTSENANCRYSTTGAANYSQMGAGGDFGTQGARHNSITLGTTADGTYAYRVSCINTLGGGAAGSTLTFTIASTPSVLISNLTTDVVFNISAPTLHVNTSENANCRYSTTGAANYSQMGAGGDFGTQGARHNSITLGTTADGTYAYRVSCINTLGGGAVGSTLTFTIASTQSVLISNLTSGATFINSKPTIHVNTSGDANCRYSTTGAANYSQMGAGGDFGTQGTRHNSFTLSDTRDNTYNNYAVSCVNTRGGDAAGGTVSFTIDTTSLWNVTIGGTGALSATKDYFTQANKFYTFRLPKTNVLATTAVNARYNVTDVLASVMGSSPGTAATNNLSVIWAYNRTGNVWTSFVYGRATNTFTNFTSDVMDYYVNLTVANERIEIN